MPPPRADTDVTFDERMAPLTNLAIPVYLFYLLVLCNFMPEIVGCRLQNVMRHNMVAKHIVGFILLLFLVVFANPKNVEKRIVQNVGMAALVYVWFFITTHAPFYITVLILALLTVAYMAKLALDQREEEKRPVAGAKLVRNGAVLAVLALSVVGFVMYVVRKKRKYGANFSIREFFLGACESTATADPMHIQRYGKFKSLIRT